MGKSSNDPRILLDFEEEAMKQFAKIAAAAVLIGWCAHAHGVDAAASTAYAAGAYFPPVSGGMYVPGTESIMYNATVSCEDPGSPTPARPGPYGAGWRDPAWMAPGTGPAQGGMPIDALYRGGIRTGMPSAYRADADIAAKCKPAPQNHTAQNKASATSGSRDAAQKPLIYKVQRGDTLYSISRAFDVPVEHLIAANRIRDPDKLSVGQTLQIPAQDSVLEVIRNQPVQKVLTTTLTAYTAGPESTGKTPSHPAYGITSSGTKAKEGRTIAVDPKVIPIGSVVYIEGIGIRTAEDTGSAIKGSRIDIFMNDVNEARKFGVKKNVKVYVLSANPS
jgi:3D (Asp-Asp-Asp) domain-containing protein